MIDQTPIDISKIAVYGAGSWGTALALQLARNNIDVLLWDYNPEHVDALKTHRENQYYLPGITFPDNLNCSNNISDLMNHADFQLIVVPSHGFRSLLTSIKPHLNADHALFWATKGIEVDSGLLLHQIMNAVLPDVTRYGVVSGPTFASEVAHGLPTAMTAASEDEQAVQMIANAFQGHNFRMYTSNDVVGVELGGAIKNILAIAAGISDGLGFGANARAAIITRGLAEIIRLGHIMGAKTETLMGLAGIGDLVLTCTDNQSRNRRLGLALGQGKTIEQAQLAIGQAIEGLKSSRAVNVLAHQHQLEMPICQQVYRILYEDLAPSEAVKTLLSRQLKTEY